MTPGIEDTVALIKQLHEGQTDHLGKPYENHPERVAENLGKIFSERGDDMAMAALLHDTMEDCGIDERYLRQKGYSADCIEMVSLVTKPPGDKRPYDQVIEDLIASGNKGAMLIKIADNMDNLNPKRVRELKEIDPEKAERLSKRYLGSMEKLSMATGLNQQRVLDVIKENCSCRTPPFHYLDFEEKKLGEDRTNGRGADVSMETCKACGSKWLHYFFEDHFSRSGRWYRGLISDEAAKTVKPETAEEVLRGLQWHIYGGSFYNHAGRVSERPVRIY